MKRRSNEDAHSLLARKYREDPVFFVEHALGHATWSKQREILRSVAENEKTAVRALHGSSKTFTAAECAAWFLNCFPRSKVITTAPTFMQVKALLWAEINKIYQSSRLRLSGSCLTTEIQTTDADHFAIGFSTDKPARAEGWHAPEILFIFDEAKGIPSWLWDSVRGLLTGGLCRWLAISTTDGVQVNDNFYNAFRKVDSLWNKIHVSIEDMPDLTGERFRMIEIPDLARPDIFKLRFIAPKDMHIQIANQAYAEECGKEWGKDSFLYLTKVKGEIIDESSDSIIKVWQVNRMFENARSEEFDDSGAFEIGVDVARGGAADSIFIKRKGLKVIGWKIVPSSEMPERAKLVKLANDLCDFAEGKTKAPIKIDDTGVGGGLTDIMEARGYNVIPINFQEAAADPNLYPNIIAEIWYSVAPYVHEISCPEDRRLIAELTGRRALPLDKKGRRAVESKAEYMKRGSRSPDMADAFLLAFYDKRSQSQVFADLGVRL